MAVSVDTENASEILNTFGIKHSIDHLLTRNAKPAPIIIVESASGTIVTPPRTASGNLHNLFLEQPSNDVASQILATKWHDCSDDVIQTTISRLDHSSSSSTASAHPYHTALRVLSSTIDKLTKARTELEESRRVLLEKEAARQTRAEELMRELLPSEREVAKRVIQSLFPDDVEEDHQVQRKHSMAVSRRSPYGLYKKFRR